MRATWITLVLLGLIPICIFHVLDRTGATEALQYISTTAWEWGHPTAGEIVLMFLSVFSWLWVKGFANLFFLAAAPFVAADILNRRRKRAV